MWKKRDTTVCDFLLESFANTVKRTKFATRCKIDNGIHISTEVRSPDAESNENYNCETPWSIEGACYTPIQIKTMKKLFMMLAIVASLCFVSCGGGSTTEGSATEEQADGATPEALKLSLTGVSGGEWDNFKPCLGEATFTVESVDGDNYKCVVEAPFESPNARAIKGITSCRLEFYYSNENHDNVDLATAFEIDPNESAAVAEFVNAGAKDVKKTFKFTGALTKAEYEALKAAGKCGHCVTATTFEE